MVKYITTDFIKNLATPIVFIIAIAYQNGKVVDSTAGLAMPASDNTIRYCKSDRLKVI